jgi:hypothetical protein
MNYAKDECAKVTEGYVRGAGIAGAMCAGSRQSAKGSLWDRVAMLRREADRLEALAGALPEKLPHEADEALWDLLIRR